MGESVLVAEHVPCHGALRLDFWDIRLESGVRLEQYPFSQTKTLQSTTH